MKNESASKSSIKKLWIFSVIIFIILFLLIWWWRWVDPYIESNKISVRQDSGKIQYQYDGGEWKDIIKISELRGKSGNNGLNGKDGSNGQNGLNGANGSDGINGVNGQNGKSAYELVVAKGYGGTLNEWINSLRAEDGQNGKSAYELAVDLGYNGTQYEWISSLTGKNGKDGQNGSNGVNGVNGQNGKSAYELAVESGYVGDKEQWLNSLKGQAGNNGREIELQKTVSDIQWRYKGDNSWNNLISILEIKGDKGDSGSNGANGLNGANATVTLNQNSNPCSQSFDVTGNGTSSISLTPKNGIIPSGGERGQVLIKKSSAECDMSWGGLATLRGTGRPDQPQTTGGVIDGTEAVGVQYISTDGAGVGANQWMKTSTGWQVVFGDTGWRELNINRAYSSNGKIYIRRTENGVYVATGGGEFGTFSITQSGLRNEPNRRRTDSLVAVPAGFGIGSGNTLHTDISFDGNYQWGYLVLAENGTFQFRAPLLESGKTENTGLMRSTIMYYLPTDSWPTSLPPARV